MFRDFFLTYKYSLYKNYLEELDYDSSKKHASREMFIFLKNISYIMKNTDSHKINFIPSEIVTRLSQKGVEVVNNFLLATLYQYLGNFDLKSCPAGTN